MNTDILQNFETLKKTNPSYIEYNRYLQNHLLRINEQLSKVDILKSDTLTYQVCPDYCYTDCCNLVKILNKKGYDARCVNSGSKIQLFMK